MTIKRNRRSYDDPQFHTDHPRPVTRRQFVAQGFMSGAAYTSGAGILGMFSNPREAAADLSPDLAALIALVAGASILRWPLRYLARWLRARLGLDTPTQSAE